MDIKNFSNLKIGDIIRNDGTGDSYVIVSELPKSFIAVRTVRVTNQMEWSKVEDYSRNRSKQNDPRS